MGSGGGGLLLNAVMPMIAAPNSKMAIAAIQRRPGNSLRASSMIQFGATVAVGVTVAAGETTVGVCVGVGVWDVGVGVGAGV